MFLNAIELRQIETEPLSHSYGAEDTSYDPSKTSNRRATTWRTRFSGWRGGVVACISIAASVLLLNIVLAVIAATTWATDQGISTAYTGDCTKAARATTALHLLINLLSSLLLGASNYCMQRLVAPTRKEIDDAHAKKRWLDIGMPSVRNLASISRSRMALWLLLGLSSIPLHFVYNSVIFETIAANDVDFLIVGEDFFTNKTSWNSQSSDSSELIYNSTTDNDITKLQNTLLDGQYLDRTKFENITNNECVSRYNTPFITSGSGFGVPTPYYLDIYSINATNSFQYRKNGSGELGIDEMSREWEFSYCLSEIVPAKCQVQFSQSILWVVIACNASKVILMVLILWRLEHQTIVTIGDAIQTFLQRPDPTTENCCLMSRRNVERLWKVPELRTSQYAAALVTTGALFHVMESNKSGSDVRNGFGKVSTNYLVDVRLPFGSTSIVPYVLLANLPQAVVSFIYLTYNGMFTCMLANREWSQYSLKRAPLRVTLPSPGQRSTYFLQLPYTFSVPLLLASVLLHWFISQSIFLARIAMYKDGVLVSMDDRLTAYRHMVTATNSVFTGLGYSDSALIASLTWGSALVLVMLLMAHWMIYPKGLPVGGTCSAVISAACHVRHEEGAAEEVKGDISSQPLKWGVTCISVPERDWNIPTINAWWRHPGHGSAL
ncbi:hypothetical protein N0V90_013129 [Kalmusia sp. IMI 367209]|nr:hypothetical protein N0V90_013129 [Kalmusia sp. IMI 367209]